MSKFDNLYGGQLRTAKEALLKERKLLTLIRDAILYDNVTKLDSLIKDMECEIGEIIEKQRKKDHK